MADAGAGRHDAEILERALRPFQKIVAFLVLLVFLLDVFLERIFVAEEIHRHRMIDDQIHRHQRVDLLRIAAEMLHRIPHGGEVDHRGHAGEILHQHARRTERDLARRGLGLEPLRDGLDVLFADRAAVLVAQQILQQDLDREGQPGNSLQTVLFSHRKAVISVGLGADLEGPEALEAVERIHDFFPSYRLGAGANRRQLFAETGPTPTLPPPHAVREGWGKSNVAGVTGAPQSDLRLIRSFPGLCQFGNE